MVTLMTKITEQGLLHEKQFFGTIDSTKCNKFSERTDNTMAKSFAYKAYQKWTVNSDITKYINKSDEAVVEHAVQCAFCEESQTFIRSCESCFKPRLRLLMDPSCHELLNNRESIMNREWFHVTHKENWHNQVTTNNAMVHVGSIPTVEEATHELLDRGDPLSFIKIRIKDNIRLANWTAPDLDCIWTKSIDEFTRMTEHDAVPYLNLFEGAGQLSLIINPQFLIVESEHRFDNANEFFWYLENAECNT